MQLFSGGQNITLDMFVNSPQGVLRIVHKMRAVDAVVHRLTVIEDLPEAGLAKSRAGRAASRLARAEPYLTSARSAHGNLVMASRATSEPLQRLGSARC